MAKSTKAFDLDEIFGQKANVEIIWDGQTHEMTAPQYLSPRQLARWGKLQNKIQRLQKLDEVGMEPEELDKLADELAELVQESVDLICTTLGAIPFLAGMRLLQHYSETFNKEESDNSPKASPPTGEE